MLKGVHDNEIQALNCDAKSDEVIIIGNRNFSKILTLPLIFNRELIGQIKSYKADNSYFDNKLKAGCTELVAIKDKTLNPKVITEEEKELLLDLCSNRG